MSEAEDVSEALSEEQSDVEVEEEHEVASEAPEEADAEATAEEHTADISEHTADISEHTADISEPTADIYEHTADSAKHTDLSERTADTSEHTEVTVEESEKHTEESDDVAEDVVEEVEEEEEVEGEEEEEQDEAVESLSVPGPDAVEMAEEQYVDVNKLPLRPPQPQLPPEKPVRRPWHPVMWDSSIIGIPPPTPNDGEKVAEIGAEYPHKQRIRNLKRAIKAGKVKPTSETLIFFLCNKFAVSEERQKKVRS